MLGLSYGGTLKVGWNLKDLCDKIANVCTIVSWTFYVLKFEKWFAIITNIFVVEF